eukprot:5605535-Heterocapsa_arctica.AAC.1
MGWLQADGGHARAWLRAGMMWRALAPHVFANARRVTRAFPITNFGGTRDLNTRQYGCGGDQGVLRRVPLAAVRHSGWKSIQQHTIN